MKSQICHFRTKQGLQGRPNISLGSDLAKRSLVY